MSMVEISDQTINTPTWRRVMDGESIKWYHQKFVTEQHIWKMTDMPWGESMTCSPFLPYAYRAPDSGVAWMGVILSIIGRSINKFFRKIRLT